MRQIKPTPQWFSHLLKGLVAVSAIMTLIALCFLPTSYHRDNSVHWPTASGVVSNIALKTYLQKTYVDKPPTTYFSPFVCYNYTVEGIPRAGTRIDFADSVRVFTKEETLEWLNRNYPVGKQVTVYYDPRNPDLAVLVPGAKDLILICWASAGTAALCCVASVVLLNRQKTKSHKTTPATGAPHRP